MPTHRKSFLIHSGLALAAAMLPTSSARAHAADRANKLNLALIGCGNQGGGLIKSFAGVSGARWAYVCDIDAARREKAKSETNAAHAVDAPRRVLDDKSVDAVVIATPDHWHPPAALLAMQAGKHVFVEKRCCQNFREGVMLCAGARKYQPIVQHGTQFRSNPFALGAIDAPRSGLIGDVLAAKAWNVQLRKSIGHEQPSAPPPGVNYDLWVGPAE